MTGRASDRCECGCESTAPCGCCSGVEPRTPEETANRPGLPALAYRVGRHATFLETMKARLSSWKLPSEAGDVRYPLEALRRRDTADPAIGLLDAWAMVGDVLTFYQERIANEGYLRTATERRSVLELGRLVGYRLRPGIAASVFLAYTMDENTKEEVLVPQGARAQSIPGPDELPQFFETSEPLKARAAWNTLVPRLTQPQTWESVSEPQNEPNQALEPRVYLKGVSTNVRPGDPLLIESGRRRTGNPGPVLFRAMSVQTEPEANRTKIVVSPWTEPPADVQRLEVVRTRVKRLTDVAPRSATANEIVHRLTQLSARSLRVASSKELLGVIRGETLPFLEERRHVVEGMPTATRLAPWLADVELEMNAIAGELDAQHARPVALGETKHEADVTRLELLTRPGSRPPANALRLSRSLEASFKPESDAGLQVLSAARPELRAVLPIALATYSAASRTPDMTVHALRLKAGLFGRHFPPRQRMVQFPETQAEPARTEVELIGEWPIVTETPRRPTVDFESTEEPTDIFLDASYDGVVPDSWVVLEFGAAETTEQQVFPMPNAPEEAPDATRRLLITKATHVQAKMSRAEYGGTGDTTQVTLRDTWIDVRGQRAAPQEVLDRDFQVIRRTAVYTQSEELELAEEPVTFPVCDGASDTMPIELDKLYSDLEPGRFLIITGERADIPATTRVPAAEAAMLAEVLHDVRSALTPIPLVGEEGALPGDRIHTFIRLAKPLSYCYKRDTVKIYANVVKATHGETCTEVLGSGDAAKPFQAFALKQPPLTFVAASTPSGAESTLQLYVNDVRWREADGFAGLTPTQRRFITKTDDEDRTRVVFGNGHVGARLPTGVENVKVVYRRGIGKPGNVRAGQISLLSTRPLGVKDVLNPLRASGGADRENLDQARENVPLAVRALDRLVSTRDYQDFARTFAGIGKAHATELTDGRRSVVHVTIAGADDIPIDEGSDLLLNLRRALREFGDPIQPVVVARRALLLLVVSARIRILDDYLWEPVVTTARSALLERLGFARRDLGQDVTRSEVVSLIQDVPGVAYVDLDAFGALAETVPDPNGERLQTPQEIADAIAGILTREVTNNQPIPRVAARLAEFTGRDIRPAEIAVLSPDVSATLVLNQLS